MTVYIEYVLIDNFVIDFLLMKGTSLITGQRYNQKRIIFCAFLGALFSLLSPIIENRGILTILFKVGVGGLLVSLLQTRKANNKFLFSLAVFLGLTFLSGGGITFIIGILGIEDKSEVLVATVILPVYVIVKSAVKILENVGKHNKAKEYEYRCQIEHKGKVLKLVGLMDSGNMLYDGDRPIIVMDKRSAMKIVDLADMLNAKKISVDTAVGKGEMTTLKIERIKIYLKDKVNIIDNVTVGIIGGRATQYGVILHPELMGEKYENKYIGDTQKVS